MGVNQNGYKWIIVTAAFIPGAIAMWAWAFTHTTKEVVLTNPTIMQALTYSLKIFEPWALAVLGIAGWLIFLTWITNMQEVKCRKLIQNLKRGCLK